MGGGEERWLRMWKRDGMEFDLGASGCIHLRTHTHTHTHTYTHTHPHTHFCNLYMSYHFLPYSCPTLHLCVGGKVCIFCMLSTAVPGGLCSSCSLIVFPNSSVFSSSCPFPFSASPHSSTYLYLFLPPSLSLSLFLPLSLSLSLSSILTPVVLFILLSLLLPFNTIDILTL